MKEHEYQRKVEQAFRVETLAAFNLHLRKQAVALQGIHPYFECQAQGLLCGLHTVILYCIFLQYSNTTLYLREVSPAWNQIEVILGYESTWHVLHDHTRYTSCLRVVREISALTNIRARGTLVAMGWISTPTITTNPTIQILFLIWYIIYITKDNRYTKCTTIQTQYSVVAVCWAKVHKKKRYKEITILVRSFHVTNYTMHCWREGNFKMSSANR